MTFPGSNFAEHLAYHRDQGDVRADLDALAKRFAVLDHFEVDTPASTFNMLNIPQTHRDLLVVWRASVSAGTNVQSSWRVDSSGSNTNHRYVIAYDEWNGAAVSRTGTAHGGTSRVPAGWLNTSDLSSGGSILFMNYTVGGSAVPFTFSSFTSSAADNMRSVQGSGFYLNGAIQHLRWNVASGNYEAGTTCTIYGLGEL